MTRIILIRHGETNWNLEGRYQGREDIPLNTKGLEQAHYLSEELEDVYIHRFISSPLKRAFQTCAFSADLHGAAAMTDDRLIEINHGTWEGQLASDIAAQYPKEFKLWHTKPHLVMMPGGECLEDVRERARAAFDEYVKDYPNETIAVVAHDAVNKAIICDLMGMGLDHFWQIKQDNTCINVLEYNDGVWRLVSLNNTHHLGYLFSETEQKGL